MKYGTPKWLKRHLGWVSSAHRKGTCPCGEVNQSVRTPKKLGNSKFRTQPKYRITPDTE
jgi:hypothetical protein